jgi:metal-responsive CopG/Arc/MetJ family transcriptional regulator
MSKLNDDKKKIKMNITMDAELQDRMIKFCQKEERSMSSLISLALKEYLSTREKED